VASGQGKSKPVYSNSASSCGAKPGGGGFALEAGQAATEWAANQGFSALIAGHHPENHASARNLQRLGFTYTHDEFYEPTRLMEPCYLLKLRRGEGA
jgi:ribosomal-protein-alanine N-acetyltransferase